MELLEKIGLMFISPRFVAFYWSAGITTLIGLLTLVVEALPDLELPHLVTALIVAGIAQVTKALNNYKQEKPMGFQR